MRLLKWALGAAVGAAGLVVTGFILVFCYQVAVAPPTEKLSKLDAIAIAYAFGFIAVVVGIACVRLIVPQLRTKVGGILDNWSFRVLAVIYALILIAGAVLNPAEALVRVTIVVLGLLVLAALRATFGWRRWSPHGRSDDDSGDSPPD